jgi:hypothetical protein
MKKIYSIFLIALFVSAIAGSAIAGKVKAPGSNLMFNPQPEPPAVQANRAIKLTNGRLAIIMNKRLYLLTPARRGRYKASNGFRFNIGARGIIIVDARPGIMKGR